MIPITKNVQKSCIKTMMVMAYRVCFSLILAMEYAITRTVMIIYIGEMSRKATNTRLMTDISQADKDLFDFLAMEISPVS